MTSAVVDLQKGGRGSNVATEEREAEWESHEDHVHITDQLTDNVQ